MSTDSLIVHPNNSTNVRAKTVRHPSDARDAVHAAAWPLRALLRLSPALAGRAAARAFFTTLRPPVRPAEAALLAASFERHEVAFGKRRLPVWTCGEGPTVLMSHGWNGRATQLAPLAGAIATAGFRAVLFDHPAHGEAAGTSTTLPEMRAALETIDRWADGADAVVAHSMGTVLTTLALEGGIAPRRLVYLAPPVSPASWPEAFARKLGLGPAIDPPLRAAIERRAGVRLASLDPRPIARTRTTPLLVVHDRDDREVPYAAGAELASLWHGAELITTHGLGHHRILREPEIGERVLAFLARLTP